MLQPENPHTPIVQLNPDTRITLQKCIRLIGIIYQTFYPGASTVSEQVADTLTSTQVQKLLESTRISPLSVPPSSEGHTDLQGILHTPQGYSQTSFFLRRQSTARAKK